MLQNNCLAYLGILCPIKFSSKNYKSLTKSILGYQDLDDAVFYFMEKKGVLVVKDDSLFVSKGYSPIVYMEFLNLPDADKSIFLYKLINNIKKHFSTSIYYDMVCTYLYILENKFISPKQIYDLLDKQIYVILSENSVNLQYFIEISDVFTSKFVTDDLKVVIANIFYKYNQNRVVANIYDSIDSKNIINAETLIKISSAYFMLSEYDKANEIITVIKNEFNDQNISLVVKIIELINKFELNCDEKEIEALKTEFYNLVSNIELTPNCANLLLKISSSILTHEEAIKLMVSSNLSNHILQVFNNLGAIYLTEGAKKRLIDPKNKDYIIKAEKYLSFAKTYSVERGEYSPYLSLNLLTLRFYKEYLKISLTKNYKTIYNNFKKLNNKADSLYFKSIILCNCLILEKLTTKNRELIEEYKKRLKLIKESTKDTKIKEKIEMFMNFIPLRDKFIPIWIITETHY